MNLEIKGAPLINKAKAEKIAFDYVDKNRGFSNNSGSLSLSSPVTKNTQNNYNILIREYFDHDAFMHSLEVDGMTGKVGSYTYRTSA